MARLRALAFALLALSLMGVCSIVVLFALTSERSLAALTQLVVTPTTTPSLSLTPTLTPIPTSTPRPTSTTTPLPTATPTDTPEPTDTPAPTDTALPTDAPSPTPTKVLPTSTPKPTATITPTRPPTSTPLPSGASDILTYELASAALVGNLSPAQNNPPIDTKYCRWVQNNTRIGCTYQVFVPPGYYDSGRRYAVVYLLHGWGGEFDEWGVWLGAFGKADAMMRSGEIPPFIIVTPEGDHTYWLNHALDGERWSDYVADELVSIIDASFRTLAKRESRAIGGLSMGGLGAIQIALNHPDEFSLVGMRSPTLRRIGDPYTPNFFGDQNYYNQYDPFVLAQQGDAAARLKSYFIIGDQDIWLGRTQDFRKILDEKGAAYEWHVYPGDHEQAFFAQRIEEDLRFYGANLAIR